MDRSAEALTLHNCDLDGDGRNLPVLGAFGCAICMGHKALRARKGSNEFASHSRQVFVLSQGLPPLKSLLWFSSFVFGPGVSFSLLRGFRPGCLFFVYFGARGVLQLADGCGETTVPKSCLKLLSASLQRLDASWLVKPFGSSANGFTTKDRELRGRGRT